MALTKQVIIEGAYQDIGFDGNIESTRLAQGLRTLDRMMGSWLNAGVDIGYMQGESSALTDDSGILNQHLAAVQMNLAVQLARALAIPVDNGYAGDARNAYRDLLSYDPPVLAANPFMPLGAGNSLCWSAPAFQAIEETTTDALADTAGVNIIDDAGVTIIGD